MTFGMLFLLSSENKFNNQSEFKVTGGKIKACIAKLRPYNKRIGQQVIPT
jgi:hypothetical protein